MFCGISGAVPVNPVVCLKSGIVYEKELISKYIQENGKEPQTMEIITIDDLLPINSISQPQITPKTPSGTSIPNLLLSLQNEYDSSMLEVFQIKQQYLSLRQELSNALYENDAAKRVIARLVIERDHARKTLEDLKISPSDVNNTTVQESANNVPASNDMDVDSTDVDGLPAAVVKEMDAKSQELSKVRRKRKPAESLATIEELEKYSPITTLSSLHSATGGGGIISMDLLNASVGGVIREWAITGGKDGHAIIEDLAGKGEIISSTKAHSKKINAVTWCSPSEMQDFASFLTASADKTVKVWKVEGEEDKVSISAQMTIKGHTGEVTGLSMHSTGAYFGSCSLDSTWGFSDISTGTQLLRVSHDEVKSGYSSIDFHPDGLLLATGTTDGVVRIWDVKARNNVQSFEGLQGKVTSINFSENGYYLATSSESNQVKLWDLRKLSNFHTIQLDDSVKAVHRVKFDYSGQYFGVAYDNNISVYLNKQWNEIVKLSNHDGVVTDFKFGKDSKYIVSSGMDRKLIVCGN